MKKRTRKTNFSRCNKKSCTKNISFPTEEIEPVIVGPSCRLRFTCNKCEVIWDACSVCHRRFSNSRLDKADKHFLEKHHGHKPLEKEKQDSVFNNEREDCL